MCKLVFFEGLVASVHMYDGVELTFMVAASVSGLCYVQRAGT